jgi:hypothetical protein
MKSIKLALVSLVSLVVLAGCGGKTMVESDLRVKGAPDWVNEGTNILNDKKGRLFHGVGSAPPMGDESLQISAADNRARAEVARILSSYMSVLSQDYISSTQTQDGPEVEQTISRNIENATKINLTGARIIGHWKQKKTNVIYAIAELDMKRVKKTMGNIENMHPGFKSHFDDSADATFDRLAKEGM